MLSRRLELGDEGIIFGDGEVEGAEGEEEEEEEKREGG